MSRQFVYSLAALASIFVASLAQARVEGQAIAGKPFGVARVTLTAADAGGPIDEGRVLRRSVPDQRAVLLQRRDRDDLDLEFRLGLGHGP